MFERRSRRTPAQQTQGRSRPSGTSETKIRGAVIRPAPIMVTQEGEPLPPDTSRVFAPWDLRSVPDPVEGEG